MRLGIALLLVLACVTPTRATIFVPMTVEDLARSSAAIVIGTVESLSVTESDERVFTLVTVALEQALKGELTTATITLTEEGGTAEDRQEVLFGTPTFQPGERVLLFLALRADGCWRTNQLAQGKFRIETDATGMARAAQHFDSGTIVVIPPGGSPPSGPIPLDELLTTVRRALGSDAGAAGAPPLETPASTAPHEVISDFTLLNNGRFFEADLGVPLNFLIDARGDAILGLEASRQAVDSALATWTNIETASIILADGGLTDNLSLPCGGPNKVRFNDPQHDIPPPVNCTGTLGIGGLCVDATESKVFNGMTFQHGVRAGLTLADGWEGCSVWTACNIAEIATHEIGHTIGLGHSSERQFEPNPVLRDATMYYVAHFDGRCASVRSDDMEGVSFLYPTATPPTITTQNPLPNGVVFQTYTVTFEATGGTPPYSWALVGGSFPGLKLSEEGVLSGRPAAIGPGTVRVMARDSKGDGHAKVFNFSVGLATPTPKPSPTPVPQCSGDCNADGMVTVDELIKGVNIALGTLSLSECMSFDANADGRVTVDELVKAVGSALTGCNG